ncbi:hypothetical protein FO441_05140 [Salinicoccus cyprini]|uniref:Uncharacterized protein n=2 Tax=Salinicoccus cyprini TaxID=2493691 RepID=A0A558AZK2_9STAP|nr:hypothetical protein FO441_05140 [Salinicoccus cyprini]
MMNIKISKVEESGQEVLVKSNTYEEDDKAVALYNRLTDEYADQTLPFFDEGEKLIRLDIVSEDDAADENKEQKECYFEYSDALLDELSAHIQ